MPRTGASVLQMPLSLGLSDKFSHDETGELVWGEENQWDEEPSSSHYIREGMIPTWLVTGDLNLDHLVMGMWAIFCFPCSIHWKWITVKYSPYSRKEELSFTFWNGASLHLLTGILLRRRSVPSPSFIFHSFFTSRILDVLKDIKFIPHVITQYYHYLFCCSYYSSFGHWEQLQLCSYVPVTCSIPFVCVVEGGVWEFVHFWNYKIIQAHFPCASHFSKQPCFFFSLSSPFFFFFDENL